VTRILARAVAIPQIEKYFADKKFYEIIGPGLGSRTNRALLAWRDFAHRRLNATIKILTYVRDVEASTIERTVERFRIAG
jgi:hypothetical protein